MPFLNDLLDVARRAPDAIAVVHARRSVSFREVVRRAEATAEVLRTIGVRKGQVVQLPATAGLDTVTTIIGVLMADAAYVIVDPDGPKARNNAMTCAAQVAATSIDLSRADSPEGWQVLDAGAPSWSGPYGDPAYVVFTSGSTAVPRGVLVSRDSLSWHARTMRSAYGLTPADRVLQSTPLVFDVVVEEVWPTLTAGATLVIPERALGGTDYRTFTEFLNGSAITVCNVPSSFFAGWVRTLEAGTGPHHLRLAVVGSEPLPTSAAQTWRSVQSARLVNAYGLSEATVTSITHDVSPEEPGAESVAIGRPLAGMTALIADSQGTPVSKGAVGELWLRGPGIAMGYLDGADPNRFIERLGPSGPERWLRTGDRAWLDGDVIRLMDRIDEQVKVHGHRIELAEVCAAVLRLEGVKDARVIAVEGELAAFVVGDAVTDHTFSERLRGYLPEYMIPAHRRWLDGFPVLATGKVEVSALRAMLESDEEGPPLTMEDIAALWAAVLRVPTVDRTSNFFQLGGDSLSAARIIAALRQDFQVSCSLADVFQAPRLDEFSDLVLSRGVVR